MRFYDTHAHLGFPDFRADLPQVIERALAADITRIVTIGTDLESSRRAVEIAEQYPAVFAAIGWHPTHVLEAPEEIPAVFRDLGRHPKVVAIGETGLDYHRRPKGKESEADFAAYKQKQARLFAQQLELAAELGLNCIIHQREAFEDTVAQMRPMAGKVRGVFHCFAETPEKLGRVLELGCLVSFTGILTFKNAGTIRQTLAAAPLESFMLETDCPFLAPVPHRGKRCEPAHVAELARVAAETKNCSLEQLSQATCQTAHEFFARKL